MPKRDRFTLITAAVYHSTGERVHAKVNLRVREDQRAPWDVVLHCVRTGGRWSTSQSWRGGLPHPDPEARRYVLYLEAGSPDLEAGDELFAVDARSPLIVVDDDEGAG